MKQGWFGPGWMGPMLGFFAGALAVSLLGGPLLLGLLAGALVYGGWHPLRHNPPWTRRGRGVWRERFARGLTLWRAARQLRRGARGVSVHSSSTVRVVPLYQREATRYDAVIRVRCEHLSERLQVWHASDTGRAYEVLSRDSYPQASLGVEGWLSFEGGRPRVRPTEAPLPERTLN